MKGCHTCLWPGCTRSIPAPLWGCAPHWRKLPRVLRDAIYAHYRPGQGVADWTPQYRKAVADAEEFARTHETVFPQLGLPL